LASFVAGFSLFVGGCAQQEASTPASPAAPSPAASAAAPTGNASPAAGGFKIGLVTPSKISDKDWGQSAYEGVQLVEKELGATALPPVEEPPAAQVATSLQDLAQQGCKIVYGHGSEYDDDAKNVATKFPDTTFVVMGGKSVGKNLIPIQFASGQATYLAGMLAAGMTKTGKIGLVGGEEIPIIKDAFAAFEHGAKAVKPSVKVTTTYTGDGKDTAKAKQQAQALLDAGADVLMHNADAAGAGVFQAVAAQKGAMVIGANSDQSDQATAQNLGSFILDVPSAMLAVAKSVKDGTTDGKPYAAGLKDKAVGLKYNDKFAGKIPDDLKAKIAKAQADMIAGTLDPSK
jgi:basic membrane lipoprotein Med (substrate-binding protein (PBP1-ABC) superfamily)